MQITRQGECCPECVPKTGTVNMVEFQWLKHLLNLENMFETGVVQANEC